MKTVKKQIIPIREKKLYVGLFTLRNKELRFFRYRRAVMYPLEWHQDKKKKSFSNLTPVVFPKVNWN